MWSIARKTLVADRGKLLTALVGVVFSIVLVNVQGGLFLGLIGKASLLIDNGSADIWVGHKETHNVDFPRDIPRRWTDRVRAVQGVKSAHPYLLGHSTMTLPDGGFEPVLLVGCDQPSLIGNAWSMHEGDSAAILQNDGIIVDLYDDDKLKSPSIGDLREIGGVKARVVARSEGILGFLVTPYIFTTLDRAKNFLHKSADQCSYVLVQLENGADPAVVCASIRTRLPEVDAYTKKQFSRISVKYWVERTGLGISFGAATLMGLLVGMIMVAETLYAMVLDRLSEFGTLKAIGATERQVCTILLMQALVMALAGSLVGLATVGGICQLFSTPRAPIVVPWWLSLGSCVLVTVICLIASLLPYLRIRKVDPMMVLQS